MHVQYIGTGEGMTVGQVTGSRDLDEAERLVSPDHCVVLIDGRPQVMRRDKARERCEETPSGR